MIRRAEPKDAPRISALLRQVLEVHAAVQEIGFQHISQLFKIIVIPDQLLVNAEVGHSAAAANAIAASAPAVAAVADFVTTRCT